MIPWQPLQVLFNLALATLAGWLIKKGVNEDDARAYAGAVGAIILPMVLAFLQRRKLLMTDPTAAAGEAAIKAFTGAGPTRSPIWLDPSEDALAAVDVEAATRGRTHRVPYRPDQDAAAKPAKTFDQLGGRTGGVLVLALVLIAGTGCNLTQAVKSIDAASIRADAARRDALAPVVQEHISRHPEQELTWSMLMQAWSASIERRRQAIASTPAK